MRKGERTRAAVLDHALALATQVGLEGLSIGSLAKQVGLSKSGLFAHFDSKEALQLQILDTAARRFIEKVITPALRRPRGEPRVRAMFDNWLAWEDAKFLPGGCPFIAMANELDDRPGPLRDVLAAAQQDWLEALATAARIAIDEGHFHGDLDTHQFAYEIYAIMLAYNHFRRLLRDPQAEPRARATFEQLLETSRA